MLGYMGLDENLLGLVMDARTRFLKNETRLIPEKLDLFIVPTSDGALCQGITFWDKKPYGLDFSPARDMAVNSYYIKKASSNFFLSKPKKIISLDLMKFDKLDFDLCFVFDIFHRAILYGFCGWFIAKLCGGINLNTHPDKPVTHWRNTFFPIKQPLKVKRGDKIKLVIRSIPTKEGNIWTWIVKKIGIGNSLTQSTFNSFPIWTK
jgi:hypothetical protein